MLGILASPSVQSCLANLFPACCGLFSPTSLGGRSARCHCGSFRHLNTKPCSLASHLLAPRHGVCRQCIQCLSVSAHMPLCKQHELSLQELNYSPFSQQETHKPGYPRTLPGPCSLGSSTNQVCLTNWSCKPREPSVYVSLSLLCR